MPRRFVCAVCGYVHEGDTPPDTCPVCGADRDQFEPEADAGPATKVEIAAAAAPVRGNTTGLHLVVLGGGIAGFSAVEAARDVDPDAAITLVHREAALPYDRLNLTRYLAGHVGRDRLAIRPDAWFAERRIRLVHAEARRLDPTGHRVVLDSGEELSYDRLVVATGAHPFVPAIPGVRRHGVHVLRTLEDADRILERAHKGAACVCIGGGLLGLEAAGGLARRGLAVTILEESSRLLSRQLASSAADLLASHLGGLGIAVRSGVKAAEIAGDESVRAVMLADGTAVPADLVVIGAGVRPNVALARSAGLTLGRGIVVDDGLRTSAVDIFAAGDVAEHRGVVWGLWSVAIEQGKLAGRVVAGAAAIFDGRPPSTQLKVLDWPVFSVGRFEPDGPGDRVVERADGGRLVRIVLSGDVVVGGNLVGDATLANELRRAVQEGRTLAEVPVLGAAT